MSGSAFDMDPLEELVLRQAEREGQISAKVCESGEEDPEGCAHRDLYEHMKDRGLLKFSGFRGSRHAMRNRGDEFVDYRPTEAGLALLRLKQAGRL